MGRTFANSTQSSSLRGRNRSNPASLLIASLDCFATARKDDAGGGVTAQLLDSFISMSSIFTKIINREIPGHFIYEDDFCVVILDKFPAVQGQSLVIPKKDIDYAFDLDDDSYIHLFQIAKRIAKASDKALGAVRTCLVVEGFDVPHVHIKIYPMKNTEQALGAIMPKGAEASDEELAIVATQIIGALEENDADAK